MEDGDHSGILGLHKITLGDEGITLVQPEAEQKIKWSGIKKLDECETHYFLYDTAVTAIIIPKRNVSDIRHLDDILRNNIG